jgi:hypothetical protein
MIPSTAAGLLALLGCIAPGLVFQLRRERHQPRVDESVLREASRIALTSLLFTAVSLAFVVWLSRWWPALPNIQLWLESGRAYPRENYLSVSLFLTLEVVIACLLALICERLTRGEVRGELSPDSVWWKVFRGDFPVSAERVSLWVTTENGTQFRGALRHYTPETQLANREMALGGSSLKRLAPGADPLKGWEDLAEFDAIVIAGSDIRHFAVQYLHSDGTTVRASRPKSVANNASNRPRSGRVMKRSSGSSKLSMGGRSSKTA